MVLYNATSEQATIVLSNSLCRCLLSKFGVSAKSEQYFT